MKRNFYLLPLIALVFLGISFSGCKKDEMAPVITLLGDADVEIALNSTYDDDGATALDDEDGDLTSDITVTNNVDPTTVGTYTVTYSVSDEAGNVGTATRNVTVSVMQSNFIALWGESDNCSQAVTANDNVNIVAGSQANQVTIIDFLDLIGGNLSITFDGYDLTVPQQTFGSFATVDVSGSGTLATDASEMVLNLNFDTALGSESCTLTYTKF